MGLADHRRMSNFSPPIKDARRSAVLAALAETGVVTSACRAAGVDRSTVFRWRQDDPEFAAEWEDALEQAADRFESEAIRRAVEGVEDPVFHQGVIVGHVVKYSDNLLVNVIRAKREAYRNQGTVQVNANVDIATAIIAARNRTGG